MLRDDFLLGLECDKDRSGLSFLSTLTVHDMDNRLDRSGSYRAGNSAPATLWCDLVC